MQSGAVSRRRSSISGWRARSSQTAQAASSAAETAPLASVAAEAHPQPGPSVSTRSSPAIPAPSMMAPAASMRGGREGLSGSTAAAATRATTLRAAPGLASG
jgi:hypothetical protein